MADDKINVYFKEGAYTPGPLGRLLWHQWVRVERWRGRYAWEIVNPQYVIYASCPPDKLKTVSRQVCILQRLAQGTYIPPSAGMPDTRRRKRRA